MWENEAEFRDFIKRKLEEHGHIVNSEVTISRFRIDLIAEKEEVVDVQVRNAAILPRPTKNVIKAIAVKLHDRGEIYNALSRCMNLSYLPQIDEVYLAIPGTHFRKDIQEHLESMPIGVIVAKEQEIKIHPPAWNRRPPRLRGGGGYPSVVSVGDIFEIRVDARNDGEKDALNVHLEWTPAGPFRRPKGEKNRKSIARLEPGQSVSMPFKVKVRSETKPGKYPIFTKISAEGLESRTSMFEVTVKAVENPKRINAKVS